MGSIARPKIGELAHQAQGEAKGADAPIPAGGSLLILEVDAVGIE